MNKANGRGLVPVHPRFPLSYQYSFGAIRAWRARLDWLVTLPKVRESRLPLPVPNRARMSEVNALAR